MNASNVRSALAQLRDPRIALPAYGEVHDQETGEFVPYDPHRLGAAMQDAILGYLADPPRTVDGKTRFMTVLAGRQGGKSLSAEYGGYCLASYTPGFDWVCIADTSDRAE